jgi:hypothetical protein
MQTITNRSGEEIHFNLRPIVPAALLSPALRQEVERIIEAPEGNGLAAYRMEIEGINQPLELLILPAVGRGAISPTFPDTHAHSLLWKQGSDVNDLLCRWLTGKEA